MRGTPQQIIDKYNQLARDAQLSNDRVAAENFQQHAEHYLRLLGGAMREMEQRREEQERQNRERQAERDRERAERPDKDAQNAPSQQSPTPRNPGEHVGASSTASPMMPEMPVDPSDADQPYAGDSGLVETPESKPAKPRQRRKPKPKAEGDAPEAAE